MQSPSKHRPPDERADQVGSLAGCNAPDFSGAGTDARDPDFTRMTHAVFDTPLEVAIADGEIVITGPDGLAGSMTLDAALKSAERLRAAAEQAGGGEIYQKPLG